MMSKRPFLLLTFMLGLPAATAFAQDPAPAPHPCAKLKAACEAGGFVKGGAKDGKGLLKDCMMPVMAGHPVTGVSVDPADVASCRAAHPRERPPQ
jgi:hypothetical protein